MKKSFLSLIVTGLIVTQLMTTKCFASDSILIRDVEALRNSLSLKDSGRPTLTLRLADLYFDQSVDTKTDPKMAQTSRVKAIELYKAALSGENGNFPPATSSMVAKIKFQMARLYAEKGDTAASQALWLELINRKDEPVLRREAALRLAESLEQDGKSSDISKIEEYYSMAIQLCQGSDVCSYAHYRRAWLKYKQQKIEPSVEEMKEALFDSRGQLREEALRDLMLFMGHLPVKAADSQNVLIWVENFSAKIQRPELIRDLSASFYSAGNKSAGMYVLEYVNSKNPNLSDQVKLLEEYYGARDWEKFRTTSSLMNVAELSQMDSAKQIEMEKVLRRLTVQLDAERMIKPEHSDDFRQTVLFYLSCFPKSSIRANMIDGWMASENDLSRKMNQLYVWIEESKKLGDTAEEVKLREFRASAAQKSQDQVVLAEEMKVLSTHPQVKPTKAREFRYLYARALYEQKNYTEALPLFKEIASVGIREETPDQWAIQSQNLALDILNQNKNYPEMIRVANSWILNPKLKSISSLKDELADIQRIADQAKFELATSQSTAESLQVFAHFCSEGKFTPKSCENSKGLAFKLKDQAALIQSLRALKSDSELTAELEAAAYFEETADRLSKELNAKSTLKDRLRVALLFELSHREQNRDQILQGILKSFNARYSEAEEKIIFAATKDAGLLNATSLRYPWSKGMKLKLAHDLESSLQGTKETHDLMVSSTEYLGEAWSRIIVSEADVLNQKQPKIGFYGKKGQKKFEQRLAALKTLEMFVQKYLQGADSVTRIKLLVMMMNAQQNLSTEILQSPIPAGVPEESKTQVLASIKEMADPFSLKATEYENLAKTQVEKISDTNLQDKMKVFVSSKGSYQDAHETSKAGSASFSALSVPLVNQLYERLHKNPQDLEALKELRTVYEQSGRVAASAYFQGRIMQLGEQS